MLEIYIYIYLQSRTYLCILHVYPPIHTPVFLIPGGFGAGTYLCGVSPSLLCSGEPCAPACSLLAIVSETMWHSDATTSASSSENTSAPPCRAADGACGTGQAPDVATDARHAVMPRFTLQQRIMAAPRRRGRRTERTPAVPLRRTTAAGTGPYDRTRTRTAALRCVKTSSAEGAAAKPCHLVDELDHAEHRRAVADRHAEHRPAAKACTRHSSMEYRSVPGSTGRYRAVLRPAFALPRARRAQRTHAVPHSEPPECSVGARQGMGTAPDREEAGGGGRRGGGPVCRSEVLSNRLSSYTSARLQPCVRTRARACVHVCVCVCVRVRQTLPSRATEPAMPIASGTRISASESVSCRSQCGEWVPPSGSHRAIRGTNHAPCAIGATRTPPPLAHRHRAGSADGS
jgi:hypothetical protein